MSFRTVSGLKRIERPMRTNSICRRHTFCRTVAGFQPTAAANSLMLSRLLFVSNVSAPQPQILLFAPGKFLIYLIVIMICFVLSLIPAYPERKT
jgi:hypothetical protein